MDHSFPQSFDISTKTVRQCICDQDEARASFTRSFDCTSSSNSPDSSHDGSVQTSVLPSTKAFPSDILSNIAALPPIDPGFRPNNPSIKTPHNNLEWNPSLDEQTQNIRVRKKTSDDICFCGPGRKRYLIAFLCSACLTIVIGMRSEMLGIIANLNNTNEDQPTQFNADTAGSNLHDENLIEMKHQTSSLIFEPSKHRQMPWTVTFKDDVAENAIYFAYLVASPIGGYLTVNHDSSFLLGCSVAMTCGINLFLPLVETIGNNVNAKFIMVVLLRLLQGLAEGCLIPAVFGVLRFWGPQAERSTLVCVAVIGVSLGPLIGLPVCRAIEKKWGWGVVFYIYANLGLIWCIFWWRLIDEKPQNDEKLGKAERKYLQQNLPQHISKRCHIRIPWASIFKSKPILAIFVTYAADDWTFQISSVCMQSFYQQIYNVDVGNTISLLSFPFLSRSIFVPLGGLLADFIQMKTSISRTALRKIFSGLGFGLKGIFFVALGYAPTEIYATVLLSLSLGFSGLAVAGYAVNVIDLAPDFSGLVMGFANSVSTFTGLLSTLIASIVVHNFGLDLHQGWRVALGLAALSQFCAVVLYLIFGSSEEQRWAKRDHELTEADPATVRGRLCPERVI